MTLIADFNSSVNVPFQRMRQMLLDGALQAGVVGANDFKVVQRGAGANQSVDVGVGFAWVQIATGTRNGMGHVTNDATANVTLTASNATNPRIDQILLRWNDTSIPTGAGNAPTLEVATGTPTAGATLDNRTGAVTGATLNDTLRLADILVPAASTSVVTANIRDRRPWARGGNWSLARTSGNLTGVAAFTNIDPVNLQPRLECSGVPLWLGLSIMYSAPAASRLVQIRVLVDGASVVQRDHHLAASETLFMNLYEPYTPAAGSHVFAYQFNSGVADGTFSSNATNPLTASLIEQVRPNASNT